MAFEDSGSARVFVVFRCVAWRQHAKDGVLYSLCMRKILPILSIVVVLALVAVAKAFTPPELAVTLRQVPARTVSGGEPDALALDLTLAAGKEDVLDVLFVKQEGTAQWQRDLVAAELWADAGATGFQGIGVDRVLATGSWVGNENGWAFTGINEPLGTSAERFFVTVDVYQLPADRTTIRLTIPTMRDAFRRTEYDQGDHGIFTRTARSAPLATLGNTDALSISRPSADSLAPVVRITEPVHGASVAHDWLVVRGVAQDVGGSAVAKVRLSVNRVGQVATWVDAVPEVTGFTTWEARLFELPRGNTLELRVQAEDWIGNRSVVSDPITVRLE